MPIIDLEIVFPEGTALDSVPVKGIADTLAREVHVVTVALANALSHNPERCMFNTRRPSRDVRRLAAAWFSSPPAWSAQ